MASNDLPDAKRIGRWLKAARERHGQYSQEQAAPLVGTTTRTMGSWERGATAPPADKFLALVLLYEANVLQLLARRPAKSAANKEDARDEERTRRAASG